MKTVDDCPGRFKCHGPANFCSTCGDVSLVCDDPVCDAHQRGEERRLFLANARHEFTMAKEHFNCCKRRMDEAEEAMRQYENGNVVMVARKKK